MAKAKSTITYYEAIGRRKSAVAIVRLYIGQKGADIKTVATGEQKLKKGDFMINSLPAKVYFNDAVSALRYELPLSLTESLDRFAVSAVVKGGGKNSQLESIILGTSRALEKVDAGNRKTLKPHGLLTRDPRVRERRKVGTGGKARRQKQSPKR